MWCTLQKEATSQVCISQMMRFLNPQQTSCKHVNQTTNNPPPRRDPSADPSRSRTTSRPRRPPPCACPSPARRVPTVPALRRRPWPPPRRCIRPCAVSSGRASRSCCSSRRSRTASIGAAEDSGPASGRGSKRTSRPTRQVVSWRLASWSGRASWGACHVVSREGSRGGVTGGATR